MVFIQIYVFGTDPKAEESQQCHICFKIKQKWSTLPNILTDYLKRHFRIHMTNGITTYLRNYPLKVVHQFWFCYFYWNS